MQKKNKVMLAATIGMVAIVIASTAVRCSVAQTAQDQESPEGAASEHVATESAPGRPGEAAQGGASGNPGEDDAATEIMALLQGTVWQGEGDPAKTVAFRDGSFVESDGSSVKLAAFDVKAAESGSGQAHMDIDIMREGDPYATPTTVIVEEREGALSVACDGFAIEKRYVQGSAGSGAVSVTGLAEPYASLIEGKSGELASAIGAWCKAHAPSAACASFDGEVYLDVRGGRVSATFHLDDSASTIVTAVYEGGAFDVLG